MDVAAAKDVVVDEHGTRERRHEKGVGTEEGELGRASEEVSEGSEKEPAWAYEFGSRGKELPGNDGETQNGDEDLSPDDGEELGDERADVGAKRNLQRAFLSAKEPCRVGNDKLTVLA